MIAIFAMPRTSARTATHIAAPWRERVVGVATNTMLEIGEPKIKQLVPTYLQRFQPHPPPAMGAL
jgi:hypothetical protein